MNMKDKIICEPASDYSFRLWIDITDIAKEFFGDIISKVEIAEYIPDKQDQEYQITIATGIINMIQHEFEKNGIRFDGDELRLTFINGKQIIIWNSETGGINKVIS